MTSKGLTRPYWLYVAAISLVGAGYVDFSLIAYHFEENHVVEKVWTPILYSIAWA